MSNPRDERLAEWFKWSKKSAVKGLTRKPSRIQSKSDVERIIERTLANRATEYK